MAFREIARRWLIANALAIVAMAICGLIGLGLQTLWGSRSVAYVAAEAALTIIGLAIFAVLTGSVLRLIVPALSWRKWLVANLVVGIAFGLAMTLTLFEPGDTEPIAWSDLGVGLIAGAVILIAVIGAIIGAIVGGLQVLALRSVATGMHVWLLMSTVSGSLALPILVGALVLLSDGKPLTDAAVVEGASAVAAMVAAAVMLPVLRRLRPREG